MDYSAMIALSTLAPPSPEFGAQANPHTSNTTVDLLKAQDKAVTPLSRPAGGLPPSKDSGTSGNPVEQNAALHGGLSVITEDLADSIYTGSSRVSLSRPPVAAVLPTSSHQDWPTQLAEASPTRPGPMVFDSDVHHMILPMYQSPKEPSEPYSSVIKRFSWDIASIRAVFVNITFTVFRKFYHIIFLGIPVLYRNRVRRVFKEVLSSKIDDLMDHMIETLAEDQARLLSRGQPLHSTAYYVRSEKVENLKILWEAFVDLLAREWKTTNLVSILLLSAITGTLQIGEVLSDMLPRTSILMSLICALMSLVYGCIYTVRFSTMRLVHKAIQWAKDGERTDDHIFWNTWVLLAMPVTWLSWSLILYIVGIMTFVWRAGSGRELARVEIGLASRIAISCLLSVGVIYLVLIIITLNRYGSQMDSEWREKIREVAAKRNIRLQGSYEGIDDINVEVVIS